MYRHVLELSREDGEMKKKRKEREEKGVLFALLGSAATAQRLLLPRLHFWQLILMLSVGGFKSAKGI